MQVRSATLTDIPNLLPLIAQVCSFHQALDKAKYEFLPQPELLYDSWLKTLLKNSQNLCLVAEDDQFSSSTTKLGAVLIATVEKEIPIYRLKEYGFIHDLWVEEDYRQQGIAKQMVKQAIAHFQKIGIQQIRLDTAIANDAARKLFSDCGFRHSIIEMLVEL